MAVRKLTKPQGKRLLKCSKCRVERTRAIVPHPFAGKDDCPIDEKCVELTCPKCGGKELGAILTPEGVSDGTCE